MSLQIKTLSKRNPVPLGKSSEAFMGDFWVIVHLAEMPKVFVLSPEEIKASRTEKENRISYWLQTKDYAIEKFENRWDRIIDKLNTET